MRRLKKENEFGKIRFSVFEREFKGDYYCHFHDFYELEYIISGSGSYHINGEVFSISEGMLFFMTPLDCTVLQQMG